MNRIATRFAELRQKRKAAFIPFVTAGDPDEDTSFAIIERLPAAGADIIELGIPFSDPMADGPVNQASYLRALDSGMTLRKILELVRRFRLADQTTPIVLMGAYNPIHAFGPDEFAASAAEAGVDGLLVVDLPAEEDKVLRSPAEARGIDIIRFLAPTTDDRRLSSVLVGARGYLYYASFAGITGTKRVEASSVSSAVDRIRRSSRLPCAVGFGIRTPDEAGQIAALADGVVVGSAIVDLIARSASKGSGKSPVTEVIDFCSRLANSVHAPTLARVVG